MILINNIHLSSITNRIKKIRTSIVLFDFRTLDYDFSSFVLTHVIDLLMTETNLLLAVKFILNDGGMINDGVVIGSVVVDDLVVDSEWHERLGVKLHLSLVEVFERWFDKGTVVT